MMRPLVCAGTRPLTIAIAAVHPLFAITAVAVVSQLSRQGGVPALRRPDPKGHGHDKKTLHADHRSYMTTTMKAYGDGMKVARNGVLDVSIELPFRFRSDIRISVHAG